MGCPRHGLQRPSFICQHLVDGAGKFRFMFQSAVS